MDGPTVSSDCCCAGVCTATIKWAPGKSSGRPEVGRQLFIRLADDLREFLLWYCPAEGDYRRFPHKKLRWLLRVGRTVAFDLNSRRSGSLSVAFEAESNWRWRRPYRVPAPARRTSSSTTTRTLGSMVRVAGQTALNGDRTRQRSGSTTTSSPLSMQD